MRALVIPPQLDIMELFHSQHFSPGHGIAPTRFPMVRSPLQHVFNLLTIKPADPCSSFHCPPHDPSIVSARRYPLSKGYLSFEPQVIRNRLVHQHFMLQHKLGGYVTSWRCLEVYIYIYTRIKISKIQPLISKTLNCTKLHPSAESPMVIWLKQFLGDIDNPKI